MTDVVHADSASHQRPQHEQRDLDDSPAGRRMQFVWRAVWWILIVNVLLFWGLTAATVLL